MKTISFVQHGKAELRIVADTDAGGYRLIRDDGIAVSSSDPYAGALEIAPLLPGDLPSEQRCTLLYAIYDDQTFARPEKAATPLPDRLQPFGFPGDLGR